MHRPITVSRLALYVLLFGLYLTVRGYHSRDGDQAYRLPILLHQQDPSLYADDPFITAIEAFNPHRGYLALLDLAARPFGLSFALFALFASTFALTCWGIDRLTRSIWPESGPTIGLVAVGLVLLAKAGNVGTNHLFEAMLLDRLIGFALGWAALALAIKGETWRPSLLVGLATVIHPSVGLQLGMFLGVTWIAWAIASNLTGWSLRSALLGLATLTLAIALGASTTIGQGSRLFDGLSPAEFRLLGVELQMAQHMVPSLWRTPQWLAWGMYILLGIVGLVASRPSPEGNASAARSRFTILFGVLLAGLGLAYVAIEWSGDLRVTVFQPFRMATIARGLALIALAGRCQSLWNRGDFLGRFRVTLIALGLASDWAFVVAGLVELTATLFENTHIVKLSTCINDRILPDPLSPRGGGKGTGKTIVVIATAIFGAVFLARHDTERGQILIIAAAVIALIVPRIFKGWTRRRIVVASLVCWGFPIAAFVVPSILPSDHPIVRSVVARCRFGETPADDVERLAVWCRSHTPVEARFITPPGPKTFRLWSLRPVAFNRAASPYHAVGLKDWSDRFRAHVHYEGSTAEFVRDYLADRHGIESRYARSNPAELAALAEGQGADYVLASAPTKGASDGRLQLLKVEGRYAVYRVVPTIAVGPKTEGRLR